MTACREQRLDDDPVYVELDHFAFAGTSGGTARSTPPGSTG
jgi:hypothetical protein